MEYIFVCKNKASNLIEKIQWSERCNFFFQIWIKITFKFVHIKINSYFVSKIFLSADSVPSSKTNIFQSKLIYCRHFRTYSRCAMFDWSDTVFRQRNVMRRRISNTVIQPRYWRREADSPEVCRLINYRHCWRSLPNRH